MSDPTITTGLASASGHWYARDGSPAYEIMGANGKMRPVTLRDARKHGLLPSVTSILGCAAKPALETWKVKQGILAALTLPRLPEETDTAFAERALTDSREQAKLAAELGTALHERIERSFRGQVVEAAWVPFVEPVRAWIEGRFPGVRWDAERSFASHAGYGGKIDLASREIGAVVDFKSKDFGPEAIDTIKAYDEHGMQLSAYSHGLGFDGRLRLNLFVSTRVPGLIVPFEWGEDTHARHLEMFLGLLAYWQADRGYYARATRATALVAAP